MQMSQSNLKLSILGFFHIFEENDVKKAFKTSRKWCY